MHARRIIGLVLWVLTATPAAQAAPPFTASIGANSAATSCGTDCLQYTIGQVGANYYTTRGVYGSSAVFNITQPSYITSATLVSVHYDDFVRLSMNNTVLYADPPDWDGAVVPVMPVCTLLPILCPPDTSPGGNQDRTLNIDITSYFRAGGTVSYVQRIGVKETGEGHSILRIRWAYPQCSDGIDNDGNGLTDYPSDPGCGSADDASEAPAPAQCRDGVDNDGDGLTDYPADPDCASADDDDERPAPAQCNDGVDNDADGKIDYPADPGCSSASDDSETDGASTCSGPNCVCGADTNGDGAADGQTEIQQCQTYEGQALCPIGRRACSASTDPTTGQTTRTCPTDPNAACIDTGGGAYYCSANSCFDRTTVVPEDEDPHSDFPANNGTINPDGSCANKLSVFSGKKSRCRKDGTQTAWQNCCDNKLGKMADTIGAEGEPKQRDYRDEATNIEFWDNQCDIEDQKTAKMADSGYCVSVGTYCAERWPLVGCVQRAQAYCCFSSKLAAMIQVQGRSQIPSIGGFGTPESPNCRGFTLDEFQALDFSKIDLSGYYNDLRHKDQTTMQQEAQGAASQTIANPH